MVAAPRSRRPAQAPGPGHRCPAGFPAPQMIAERRAGLVGWTCGWAGRGAGRGVPPGASASGWLMVDVMVGGSAGA